MFLASPLQVLTHTLPKRFMIITNDGTKGDLVHRKCRLFPGLYDFHFPLNGVEIADDGERVSRSFRDVLADCGLNPHAPYLLCPARYDRWKRQDLALDVLVNSAVTGSQNVQLLCCGHVYDGEYHRELIDKAKLAEVFDRVALTGPLPEEELRGLMRNALAVLSLYDLSNLGNVFIEAAMEGAVIITRNDGSTEFLLKDGENGYAVDSPTEAAAVVRRLRDDPQQHKRVSERMRADARNTFETWEQRSRWETELLTEAARH
jgi:glycosyltransferase involved in cell wall biosynthesis